MRNTSIFFNDSASITYFLYNIIYLSNYLVFDWEYYPAIFQSLPICDHGLWIGFHETINL